MIADVRSIRSRFGKTAAHVFARHADGVSGVDILRHAVSRHRGQIAGAASASMMASSITCSCRIRRNCLRRIVVSLSSQAGADTGLPDTAQLIAATNGSSESRILESAQVRREIHSGDWQSLSCPPEWDAAVPASARRSCACHSSMNLQRRHHDRA